MNDAKNETEGTWYNNSDSGSFYMLKRPTGSQEFSISDLEGTWNITYYYTGEPTAFSGQLAFDNQGILTSGSLTTEQIILKSGGATFYDFNAGIIYCSVLWEDGPNYVVEQMVGTMNPGKDEISGQWADWLGYSGTVTLTKEEPLPTGGGGGGGGGGG